MIDLRKEMDIILSEFGHPVLLQRTSRKIRCICWNELYQEAKSDCPICNGTAWKVRIEKHKVRKQDASVAITRPNRVQDTALGDVAIGANIFFMRFNAHPVAGDLIFEVGWDGSKPTNIFQVHEINSIEPERGKNGRIEYYRIHTRASNINFAVREIRPYQSKHEILFELVHGKRG